MNKVVVPIVALAAAGLAGCGSSSGTSSGSAGAGLNGEQTKPAEQVLSDAKSALSTTKAVHVRGTASKQGQTEMLDVQFQGEDTAGTVQQGGVTLNIIKTGGKLYVKAPEQFWAKTVGPAAAPKLANKWLVQDAAKSGNANSLTLQGIAASLNATGSPLKPGVTTGDVNGQKVVLVTKQDGSQLAVANTGAPLPLTVTGNGPARGSLTFTAYGQTQPITAPPGAISAQQAAQAPTVTRP